MSPDLASPAIAALRQACSGAPLPAQSQAFDQMEEAIALERACAALALLSEACQLTPWVHEIGVRERSRPGHGIYHPLVFVPKLHEDLEREAMSVAAQVSLHSIIQFAVASTRLSNGSVSEEDMVAARAHSDAMRSAFWLAGQGKGFSGVSAEEFRNKAALAESELARAMDWSARNSDRWLPHRPPSGASWEKKIERKDMGSAEDIARALGWPELAAELERRALADASADPHSPGARAKPRL